MTSPPISGESTIGSYALPLQVSVQRQIMDQISQGEFVELADLNPARLLEPRRQDRTTLSSWSEILSIYRSLDQGLL